MSLGRVFRSGLRLRLVAALVVTSAVTLAVAAAALLPPLQRRLRHVEIHSLVETAVAARPSFEESLDTPPAPGDRQLRSLALQLERRTGARVAIFDARENRLVDTRPNLAFGMVPDALSDGVAKGRVETNGGAADQARVAVPFHIRGRPYALALVKPLDNDQLVVRVVRHAFIDAAIAGLLVALVLGIGFSARLLRRLRRLRAAAVAVGERGLGVELAPDPSRDEFGDLSRAFRAMQAGLRAQEEARKAFVGTASHELRTPLASLGHMLELLEQDLSADPPDLADAREQAERAREQLGRLSALSSDLLDLSRLDARVPLRTEPLELGELVRAVSAEFELRAADAGVHLSLSHSDDVWASGDPGGVARIARILVDNALRFAPAGSTLNLDVGNRDRAATITVRDRGPGIPEEEREVVFQRFRRGTHHGDTGGFGLGLAIGRELAERMDAELVLTDATPGASFELRLLPAAVPSAEPAPVETVP